jgi:hypothetical protein
MGFDPSPGIGLSEHYYRERLHQALDGKTPIEEVQN